jgi:hypothetical protein
MNRWLLLTSGLGLGAAGMYLLDPNVGRRRRVTLRDQGLRNLRRAQCGVRRAGRDALQRAWGFVAELRHAIVPEQLSDPVLQARIRAKLGRFASHPHAIRIAVCDGRVEVSGPILADEVEGLLRAVRAVPGVRSVDNRLDAHQEAGTLSALQGGRRPPGEHWNLNERRWAPGTRFGAAMAGFLLVGLGVTQKFPVACALGTAGLGLMGLAARSDRAVACRSMRQVTRPRSEPSQSPEMSSAML